MEASDLEVGFTANGHTGSELRGIDFRRYATPVASIGAVRAWSDNMIVENVSATDSAYAGITAIGENITITNSTMSNNGASADTPTKPTASAGPATSRTTTTPRPSTSAGKPAGSR